MISKTWKRFFGKKGRQTIKFQFLRQLNHLYVPIACKKITLLSRWTSLVGKGASHAWEIPGSNLTWGREGGFLCYSSERKRFGPSFE